MSGLTAADYADTGQWRLIVNIYQTGMTAFLENTLHADLDPELLFSSEWEQNEETLLSHIENAVYDHPRVLDDFSAKIIVYDPHTLFIPTSIMEDTEGIEETFYTSVYKVEPQDIMTDTERDVTALFSPASGLKGFLSRTFPGAKVECHLMAQIRQLKSSAQEGGLFVTVREGESDFILFKEGELYSASTHPTLNENDVVYHSLNIVDTYGLNVYVISVTVSGDYDDEKLREAFSRFISLEQLSVNKRSEHKA
ncbi:MAG: DUF3822 family protein [Muribaculaceae bacterium]|nr:DUF3822 family protein [Muribaculaceae bacterium]